MIRLSNGHFLDYCCAAGALGFDGRGYLWEWPFRWAGLLRPQEFTVITKTLTARPRRGKLRWWCPWRCVRLLPGGVVNTVGLSNPGLTAWINRYYPTVCRREYKVIVSILPENVAEAKAMARSLTGLRDISGIEINLSCPNVSSERSAEIALTVVHNTHHPVIAKLSYDNYKILSRELAGQVEAVDVLNAVRWKVVFPDRESPLGGGGVSGPIIKKYAREALRYCVGLGLNVLSGGGIDGVEEVLLRADLGAGAVTLGTVFMKTPWVPNQIVRECRKLRCLDNYSFKE